MKFLTTFTAHKKLTIFFCAVCFFTLSVSFARAFDLGESMLELALSPIAALFYMLAIGIGGIVSGIGGLLLDVSISQTVVKMGNWLGAGSGIGIGVRELWSVVRDLINILFIFGLIYIGIKTILNSDDSSTKRTLGLLIVAALMINFSLYITQGIVDFSNIAATQIYTQIQESGLEEVYSNSQTRTERSIAGAFLNAANISSFFGGKDSLSFISEASKIIVYSLFMMVFLIIAGIVFAMGAVLLISRFIALIIYMIFSPAMFLGFILPALGSYQKQWWNGFLKQAFFAPAFLFMLYMSLFVLGKLQVLFLAEGSQYSDIMKGKEMTVGNFTIILFFCLMIGFLYASIKVAQMMGGAGAATSLKVMGNMGKSIRGATQGYIGRNTIGRGSEKLLERYDKAVAEGRRKPNSFLRNRLEAGTKAKFGSSNSWDSATSFDTETNKRSARITAKKKVSDSIAGATSALAVPHASRTPDQKLLITSMERSVKNASSAQLIEIAETKEGREMLEKVAGTLSASQVKALVDSDKLADDFKDKLGQNRMKQVLERVTDVGKANKADLSALGPDMLAKADVAVQLSEKQIDALDFADTDKDAIKKSREDALIQVAKGGTVGTYTLDKLKNLKPADIADLPNKVFKEEGFTQALSLAALSEIGRKKNPEVQRDIRSIYKDAINNVPSTTTKVELDRLADIDSWFNNNPRGIEFGK